MSVFHGANFTNFATPVDEGHSEGTMSQIFLFRRGSLQMNIIHKVKKLQSWEHDGKLCRYMCANRYAHIRPSGRSCPL